ncbi:MAG TPA: SAV_6107 family HEPN domain-containing protein [Nocardioidaceae bacterium]|nr:SAV_6107 family HEPN domain-containing protein [Nocardioidaceae bacterium]
MSAPVPATAVTALLRARSALDEAAAATEPTQRYATAHVAALRATAALLAVRTHPSPRRGQRNAWSLLARVAPEMAEWATFFAAGAGKRAAAEAGLSRLVSARDADDLVRDVERYLLVVQRSLGASVEQTLSAWPDPADPADVA